MAAYGPFGSYRRVGWLELCWCGCLILTAGAAGLILFVCAVLSLQIFCNLPVATLYYPGKRIFSNNFQVQLENCWKWCILSAR